jgi:hypothetical protein
MQKGVRILKPKDNELGNFISSQEDSLFFSKNPNIDLHLHFFTTRYIEEYDVNYCDNFCENPGKWIM